MWDLGVIADVDLVDVVERELDEEVLWLTDLGAFLGFGDGLETLDFAAFLCGDFVLEVF